MAGPTTIRELLVRIGVVSDDADLLDLTVALNQAKELALSVIDGLRAVGEQVAEVATRAERAASMAKTYGTTADEVQRLEYALGQSGIEASDMADILGTLADKAVDAAAGSESMVEDFGLIGLNVKDLRGLKPVELFNAVADAIASTTDPTKKAAAMSRIFGDDISKKIGPAVANGTNGLRAMGDEAQRLGYVMDDDTVAALSRVTRGARQVRGFLEGLRTRGVKALTPAIEELVDRFNRWIDANGEAVGLRLEFYLTRIGEAAIWLADRFAEVDAVVVDTFGSWESLFGKAAAVLTGGAMVAGVYYLVEALAALQVAAMAGGAAWTWFVAAFSAGTLAEFAGALAIGFVELGAAIWAAMAPLLPWIAAAVVVVAVVDDLLTYFRGGKSVIGDFIAGLSSGEGVLGAIGEWFAWLKQGAIDMGAALLVMVDQGVAGFWSLWEAAKPVRDLFAAWFGLWQSFGALALQVAASLAEVYIAIAERIVGAVLDFGAKVYALADAWIDFDLQRERVVNALGAAMDWIGDKIAAVGDALATFFGKAGEVASWIAEKFGQGVELATTGLQAAAGATDQAGAQVAASGAAAAATVRSGELPGGGAGGVSNSRTVNGGPTTINAPGMDRREAEGLFDRLQGRQARAALAGRGGATY